MSDGRNGLPPGWATTTLGDVAAVKGGLTKGKKRKPDDVLVTVPYLRVANVQRGFLDLQEVKTIEATPDEVEELRLLDGDVLFNEGGDRDKLGRGWVWEEQLDDCIHQNHVFRARFGAGFSPKFVSLYANHMGQAYFLKSGKQTTNLASINMTKLKGLPLRIAPPAEQKRIVAKIEALQEEADAAKEALDAIPPLLEKFRQSVLASAFRGDLTKAWREAHPEAEPASKLLERIREERRLRWEEALPGKKYKPAAPVDADGLPELPKGWCWASVEELTSAVAPVVYGIILPGPHVDGGVPFVRPADITDGRVELDALPRTSPEIAVKYRRAALRSGDLVFSIVGTIGKWLIVPDWLEGANITQSSVRIRPVAPLDAEFILRALQAPTVTKQMDLMMFGNAVQRLNVEHVRRLAVPVPPHAEWTAMKVKIRAALEAADAQQERVSEMAARHAALGQAILAKAFRGELVPQDPDDEPASKLLERIHRVPATNERSSRRRDPVAAT